MKLFRMKLILLQQLVSNVFLEEITHLLFPQRILTNAHAMTEC